LHIILEKQTNLSIVIPVYGCVDSLNELYLRLVNALGQITVNFEIILINDNSPDDSWSVVSELCFKDYRVKGINLSRNFGQHNAITSGVMSCSGDWVVIMDCDLQDKPEEILRRYDKALQGYNIVFAQRTNRTDGFVKKSLSRLFYKGLAYFTDTEQDHTIGNFGIYCKKSIQSVLTMNDKFRFFPAMIKWVGFKSALLPVEHNLRSSGKTSYNIKKLIDLGLNTVLTFSDKPLRLTIKFGLSIVIVAIIFSVYILIRYFNGQIIELGWTSLIISIWLLSGIIILILGIIGLYVGRTFDNVKNRPIFIIKEKLNF